MRLLDTPYVNININCRFAPFETLRMISNFKEAHYYTRDRYLNRAHVSQNVRMSRHVVVINEIFRVISSALLYVHHFLVLNGVKEGILSHTQAKILGLCAPVGHVITILTGTHLHAADDEYRMAPKIALSALHLSLFAMSFFQPNWVNSEVRQLFNLSTFALRAAIWNQP